ncbi:MAG: prephenate dehydratase [Rothia sp. (in: high G+C Gram-positive bacteria)]|nr:prephenate dehydratase [Rothia sp. (in: high G+C Gram-positive bacteria)]
MRYTYLGPSGTFTEAALLTVPGALEAERTPASSVPDALEKLRTGQADAAMVPIENSVEGGVTATLDAIAAQGADLRIVREVLVPITFVLAARPGVTLADIKTVSTHTHAWAQVRAWVAENLPQVDYLPGSSTASAALGLLRDAPGYQAAICAPTVVQQHPELQTLAHNIGDNKNAVTRFVLVARNAPTPEPTGADKTTLVIPLPQDRPGALLDLLEQFSTRGINLSRIESRPTGEFLGSYFFSIDIDGHLYDARVRDALRGIHRVSPGVLYLGSYPRADKRLTPVDTLHSEPAFDAARTWVESLFVGGRPADLKHNI